MHELPPELHVVADPAVPVAQLLAEQARRGGSIVLTGGSSVADAYRRAAELEPDWSKVTLWWGDERCVPPEDERSNYRLAQENLLDRLEQQPHELHRIRGELQPADAAGELDQALDGVRLDLLLLGLGPDGHMASLFPGSPLLRVEDRRHERPGGARTVGRPGDDDAADAPVGCTDRLHRQRCRQGRGSDARLPGWYH